MRCRAANSVTTIDAPESGRTNQGQGSTTSTGREDYIDQSRSATKPVSGTQGRKLRLVHHHHWSDILLCTLASIMIVVFAGKEQSRPRHSPHAIQVGQVSITRNQYCSRGIVSWHVNGRRSSHDCCVYGTTFSGEFSQRSKPIKSHCSVTDNAVLLAGEHLHTLSWWPLQYTCRVCTLAACKLLSVVPKSRHWLETIAFQDVVVDISMHVSWGVSLTLQGIPGFAERL